MHLCIRCGQAEAAICGLCDVCDDIVNSAADGRLDLHETEFAGSPTLHSEAGPLDDSDDRGLHRGPLFCNGGGI